MSEKDSKPYTSKRWTDIPIPETIGYTEFTEEEREENDRKMEEMMRHYGVIKSNEYVRNGKVIKE